MPRFQEPAQLHNHSKYSLLDAVPSPEEWVGWCLENNTPGFAITDHGTAISMYDALRFPEYIKKYNKKNGTDHAEDAVIGIPAVELYVKLTEEDAERWGVRAKERGHFHITVWACSTEGYFNLMKLASVAYEDTVSYFGSVKARVTFSQIEQYKDGLKFGTGCIAGPIGSAILHDDDYEEAEKRFQMYQKMFGDDLYIEFHPTDITHDFNKKTGGFDAIAPTECACDGNQQLAYNKFLMNMVDKYGGKPIPVTDAHFIAPEDKIIQDCVELGTPILTKDKGFIFIEDIVPGDYVLTHKNRWRKVEETRGLISSKDKVNIYIGKNNFTTFTADHKVLTRRGKTDNDKNTIWLEQPDEWKPADKLEVGDFLFLPYSPLREGVGYTIDLSGYFSNKDGIIYSNLNNVEYKYPTEIIIDNSIAYFFGLFIGDGHASNGQFSLCVDKNNILGKELLDQAAIALGFKWRKKESKVIDIWYGDVGHISRWLQHTFYEKKQKLINSEIFYSLSEELQDILIKGLYEADGRRKGNSISILMTSYQAIGIMADWALSRGLFYKIERRGGKTAYNKNTGYLTKSKSSIGLRFNGIHANNFIDICNLALPKKKSIQTVDHVIAEHGFWFRIKQIDHIQPNNIPVFDMQVEEDHSFTTSQYTVSNCMLKNGNDNGWYFYESYHAKTAETIYKKLHSQLGDWLTEERFASWIENTHEVMNAAKDIEVKHEFHLPRIEIPAHIQAKTDNYDDQTFYLLMEKCKEHGRWNDDPIYIDRFKQEIGVIMKNDTLNFLPYFLMFEDICAYARSQGTLQGIARGSAGGSIISYYLKIIHIDPIENDLPFERFLSHARIAAGSFPDIDCDFGDRTPIIEYLQEKYGLGFAQISTFQRMKIKNAIKDSMWAVYGRNREDPEIKAVCATIPDSPQGIDEHDFLYGFTDKEDNYHMGLVETNKHLENFFKQYPEVESMCKRLIGIIRGWGRHASAYVISTVDLANSRVPTMQMYDKHSDHNITVTQFDASMCESSGLVKADILGVTTINALEEAIELIRQSTGTDYLEENDKGVAAIYRLPEDQIVYTDFLNKKTDSSFQFNTGTVKGHLKQFRPQAREHLSLMTALLRPGAMDAPFINEDISLEDNVSAAQYYMDVRSGKRRLNHLHSDLESYTSNGVFCIAEGSLVKTDKGQINIENICPGMKVLTEDGSYQEVLCKTFMGYKDTLKIRLSGGEELVCTPDHKILTDRGWIEAQELTPNHLVKDFWVNDEVHRIGDDKDWLIGLLIADGDMCSTSYNIACSSEVHALKIVEVAIKEFNIKGAQVEYRNRCWYADLRQKKGNNGFFNKNYEVNKIKELCKTLNLDKKSCKEKRLPESFNLNMLAGIFDGDGCVSNRLIRLANKTLAKQIHFALDSMRISSSYFDDGEAYCVKVNELEKLPLKLKINKEVNNIIKVPRTYIYDYKGVKRSLDGNLRNHFATRLKETPISKSVCEKIIGKISKDKHTKWSSVLSIKNKSILPVYDLTVKNNHSFVVGGHVVHNCYQEQIMKFLVEFAGYTLEESDRIRGAIAKKKAEVMMEAFERIRKSCKARGWTKTQADTVCNQVLAFSRYSFNKSHSRAYSELGYITMYLKHFYPLEWWSAVLNTSKEEKMRYFMTLLGDMVKPPSIAKPSKRFTIESDSIIAPISALKRVGPASVQELTEKGPFLDLNDFIDRVNHRKVNVGHFGALVRGRATDCFMDPSLEYDEARKTMMETYTKIRKCKAFAPEMYELDPMSVFMMERETNKCFNKSLLSVESIVDLIDAKWPALRKTGREGIPFVMGKTPVLANLHVAEGLVKRKRKDEVGMILLYEGSKYKSINSKKTGKQYDLLEVTLSDGFSQVVCSMWGLKKALGWDKNSLVYVRGTLSEGFKMPVSITAEELERIQ